jgi:HK97 family phage portal protein
MIFDRGLRNRASGTGVGLGGALTLERSTGWDGWIDADNVSLSRDKAMKVSAVSRCVELRSDGVAMLPIYVMDETSKKRLGNHRLRKIMWNRVNEAMTRYDYEKLMQVNLDLKGNAYAWISRSAATGYPQELIPLRPDDVTPYVTSDSSLYYFYVNPRTGEFFRLDPADVLHYKGYSTDGIEGISILRRAALTISTSLSASQVQQELYANGGRPSGVLKTDTDLGGDVKIMSSDGTEEVISKKEYIRRDWEKIHTGTGKRFRMAVLDNGLDYTPIAMSNADAQYVESEENRVADIARFFGVPLHLLNAGKQAYSSNEQNSIEFVTRTLLPLIVQREQEDSYKLLLPSEREKGLRVKREVKMLLRGDTAAQAAWYKAMRECGVYSVDDICGLEDLPSVPGGDGRYASLNYVPLADWAELSRTRAEKGAGGEK